MGYNKAARRPAANAGFLVTFSVSVTALSLFILIILLNSCTSLTRAQQKPDAIAEMSPGNDSVKPAEGIAKGTRGAEIAVKEKTVQAGVTFEGIDVSGMNRNQVEELVSEAARDIEREAKDAVIDPNNWNVSQSEEGIKVDIAMTVSKIMNAGEGNSIKIIKGPIEPALTQKKLREGIIVIAQFTTPLIDKSPGRVNNIKLAARQIDYLIVASGKEFSFNKSVGKTTASEGYKKAIIIGKDNKREYEVGGGICQLSTTLFNTAEIAGVKVIERHSHTTKVPYIVPGKDAMVNDGNADMRFLNTRKYPIMIRTEVGSNYVKTWFLENRNEGLGE